MLTENRRARRKLQQGCHYKTQGAGLEEATHTPAHAASTRF